MTIEPIWVINFRDLLSKILVGVIKLVGRPYTVIKILR